MNISALFSALSDSIIISMVYGLTIYFVLKFAFNFVKQINPEWKYRIFYGLLLLIFLSFLISVVRLYIVNQYIPDHIIYFKLADLEKTSSAFDFGSLIQNNSAWIGGLYLAGILIQSLFLASGLSKIKNLKKQQKTDLNIFWDERLVALKQKLEIGRNVMLFFSKSILVPLTVGFVKPVILFPAAMLNHLSIEEVESILLHELAHIKRNDYGLNLLQRIMEIILFFNPAVWLLSKDIKREREFCCDDLVIEKSNNSKIYATALATLESNRENISLALAANGPGNYPLLNRIQRITTMKSLNNPKQQLLTTLGIVAIGLSLAWAIPSDTSVLKLVQNQDTIIKAPAAPETGMPALPLAPPPPPEFKKVNKRFASKLPAPPAPPAPVFMVPPPPAPPLIDTNELKKQISLAEWKEYKLEMKSMAEEMKKQFNSPEWKKQMHAMHLNAEEMKKQFNSPEWKKQMHAMQLNAEEMKKHFNSPEWKKQMEEMKMNSEEMKKHFNSPEWKKQMEEMKMNAEEMKKQFNSPEWKKQMEEMKLNSEKMKEYLDSKDFKTDTEVQKKQKN